MSTPCASRRARWALARHPHRAGSGRRVGPRCWGGGTGRGYGDRLATAGGRPPGSTPRLDPADDAAFAAWLDDPDRPEGPPRRQGTATRPGGPRVDGSGVGERHRAVRLRGAAGPAVLRPRRPGPALPAVGCAPRTEEPESSSSPSTVATRPGSARARRSGHVRCWTSPGFSTTSSRNAADGACSTRWSFHSSASSHRWNGPESPSTSTSSSRSRSLFGDAVKRAADDACAAIGHEVNLGSPKQLQVVLFDDLQMQTKRTRPLHDRRRCAGRALCQDGPVPRGAAGTGDASRLRVTVEGLLKRHRRRRPDPRRSTRRSHRPAGCPPPIPTCRTSRSVPTRAARSARPSSSARCASRCSAPTTARSRCGS